jgi:DNA-binding MarR family transcriptional regulator
MVALLDALEQAGIVARHPSEQDRRRNVIELTKRGREILFQAEQASLAVENDFVSVLGDGGANDLRRALGALVGSRATDG